MKSILTIDKQSYKITAREYTDNGYLRVPGRVARIGIQQYLASELGLTDRPSNEIVNVYRPPEEVFNADSLATYEQADVTDDHPPEMVDSSTFRRVSIGNVTGPGVADGEYVVAELIIKDHDAIKKIESGKAELSAGYENEYHREPGVTADGEEYEFVQRKIKINHVALVDKARAGNKAKLFDKEEKSMATVTIDGKLVTVGDDSTALLIQRALDAAEEKAKDMKEKYDEASSELEKSKEEKEKLQAAKDMAEEEAKKTAEKSSDAAIADRIKELSDVRDTAAKILGDKFSCDSINPLEIKKSALSEIYPTRDWNAQSEAYIQAAWDIEGSRTFDQRTEDAARKTHDGFAQDVSRLYMTDSGKKVGDDFYDKRMRGEA